MRRSSPRSLRSVLLLACFVLAVALACKKKKEPSAATVARAAELKPKVTQVLAQVASLSAKAKSDPPSAPALVLGAKPAFGTVSVLGEKFLEKPNLTGEELDLSDPVLAVCKYVIDRGQVQDDESVRPARAHEQGGAKTRSA